jgi:hypothetical protein
LEAKLNLKPVLSFCLLAIPLGAIAQTRAASPPTMPDAQERVGTQYFEQKDYAASPDAVFNDFGR